MPIRAILFGSIGVLCETSDIQRRAYNSAMAYAGLSWEWDTAIYSDLLEIMGGQARLALLAAATGTALGEVTIEAIHARKTDLACAQVREPGRVQPRPGVIALAQLAKARGLRLGFVTTTYQPNIDAIFAAIAPALTPADFDYIVARDTVARGKPAPDAYHVTLKALGIAAADALAIKDTALSVMSARRAGIATIATPGALTRGQGFWQADLVLEALAGSDGVLDPRLIAMIEGEDGSGCA